MVHSALKLHSLDGTSKSPNNGDEFEVPSIDIIFRVGLLQMVLQKCIVIIVITIDNKALLELVSTFLDEHAKLIDLSDVRIET